MPTQIYQRALKLSSGKGEEDFGEVRLERNEQGEFTGECVMVSRDMDQKRVILKMSGPMLETTKSHQDSEEGGVSLACLDEKVSTGSMRVSGIINSRITCLPKIYKVGDIARSGFQRSDEVKISKVDINA